MKDEQYVFCLWEGRFWPAKCIKHHAKDTKSSQDEIEVEVLYVGKRVQIKRSNIIPHNRQTYEDVSQDLEKNPDRHRILDLFFETEDDNISFKGFPIDGISIGKDMESKTFQPELISPYRRALEQMMVLPLSPSTCTLAASMTRNRETPTKRRRITKGKQYCKAKRSLEDQTESSVEVTSLKSSDPSKTTMVRSSDDDPGCYKDTDREEVADRRSKKVSKPIENCDPCNSGGKTTAATWLNTRKGTSRMSRKPTEKSNGSVQNFTRHRPALLTSTPQNSFRRRMWKDPDFQFQESDCYLTPKQKLTSKVKEKSKFCTKNQNFNCLSQAPRQSWPKKNVKRNFQKLFVEHTDETQCSSSAQTLRNGGISGRTQTSRQTRRKKSRGDARVESLDLNSDKPVQKISTRSCSRLEDKGHNTQSPFTSHRWKKLPISENRKRPMKSQRHNTLPDFTLEEIDMSHQSSDLSLGLSLTESLIDTSVVEDEEEDEEEEEEEEELPSIFLESKKSCPIAEGACVWCKFRKYPFWPALVKSVNHKNKKASIVFVEQLLTDKPRKGLCVSLRTLKPFDCDEKEMFINTARETYDRAIDFCVALIDDYIIRIGGRAFSGSFTDYCTSEISHPVRKEFHQGHDTLTFPSCLIQAECDDTTESQPGDSCCEQLTQKKLLPDRSKAARNKANQKLVQFIVKTRGVEKHLQAIIAGKKHSKWLTEYLKPSRFLKWVDTYLEDESQLWEVLNYLKSFVAGVQGRSQLLADNNELIFNVLLPEAVIFAISAVDRISIEKAEEKYNKGPDISAREREEFDQQIEREIRMKAAMCLNDQSQP
ncbi:PWWP domain-containing DNA repair factor 3B-like [Erpetoichthys calabaricus]|uniref:PWWP domain-containing protein MUM1L1 n=2 Tax=Erpetoichthys calabaricus TaxID=27687 RepID=A0A8C4TJC4_ERPCA|nr:PWWP domain-containing DNA repair factor 3B-like [Erpetoichthys calabaricus]